MKKYPALLVVLLLLASTSSFMGCFIKRVPFPKRTPKRVEPMDTVDTGYQERGIASWYGIEWQNKPTASGEPFDTFDMTAAHKSLPFDTRVKVKNLDNGRETLVRINDRGPFIHGRIIDLSKAAAQDIDMIISGVANVLITVVQGVSTPPSNMSKPVTIQVGSFGDRSTAEDLKARLSAYFTDVRIEPFREFFRVRVGRYMTEAEASSDVQKLRNMGMQDIFLTRN